MYRNYSILFSIDILHTYYADGLSTDFEIVPSASCRQLLRDHGLLFKVHGKKGLILFPRFSTNKEKKGTVIRPITDVLRFGFMLKLRNVDFQSFTQLGKRPESALGSSVLYLSNLDHSTGRVDEKSDEAGRIILSERAQASEADFYPSVGNTFHLPVAGVEYAKVDILRSTIGIPHQLITTLELNEKQVGLSVDLRKYTGRTSGRYTLMLSPRNPNDPTRFHQILVTAEGMTPDHFGYLEIFLDETIDYDSPYSYILPFETIKRAWEYIVVSPANEVENGMERTNLQYQIKYIAGTNSEHYPKNLSFRQPQAQELTKEDQQIIDSHSPREVAIFKSEQEIPLLERKLTGLQLQEINTEEATDIPKVLVEHLPNPPTRFRITPKIFINL